MIRYRVKQFVRLDFKTGKAIFRTLCNVPEYIVAVNVSKAYNNSYVVDSNKNILFSNMDLPFSTMSIEK